MNVKKESKQHNQGGQEPNPEAFWFFFLTQCAPQSTQDQCSLCATAWFMRCTTSHKRNGNTKQAYSTSRNEVCRRRNGHLRPNPSHSFIAIINLSFVFSRLSYSGSSMISKQVWAVGSSILSGPILWITNPSLPRPPIGALLDPVTSHVREGFRETCRR